MKKNKKLRVVVADPGNPARVEEIDAGLPAMQAVVGGFVDVIRVGDLDVWVNDEGLLLRLPFNRMIGNTATVGTIFVAASTDDGETIGLTDEQVERALSLMDTAPRVLIVEAPTGLRFTKSREQYN